MPLPALTDQEQTLVEYIKTTPIVSSTYRQNWFYVLIALLFVECGIHLTAMQVAIAGIAMLACARTYELFITHKWLAVYRSIFDKYDAAIAAADALTEQSAISK